MPQASSNISRSASATIDPAQGKLRLLDLYCNAGGGAKGYQRAGWYVVGVDIVPQPRYVGDEFMCADALSLSAAWIAANFDGVHASPPCQFGTELRHAPNGKQHPNLIPATRKLLKATGLPYIIENVRGAKAHLHNPIVLCGSMFGLGAAGHYLQRHRHFESNIAISAPGPCQHVGPCIGVYGAHVRCRSARHGGRRTRDFDNHDKPALAREAMGMDWATFAEMSEAIPPAYTEHLGGQLLSALAEKREAA